LNKVERLLFLVSSCIYPRLANQPIKEDSLLSGALEPTNEWYAIAKITGIKLIQAYRKQYGYDWISAMPTNLYGPGDNYDLESSHVLPALLRKFHEAKISNSSDVMVWGSGKPLREFMHCDDLAGALLFLLKNYSDYEHINVGSGNEVSIRELVEIIAKVVGYEAKITWDEQKPDGTPRKLMDSTKLQRLGWDGGRSLFDGIFHTYNTWLKH
jgi:GDP-L-fucose synthase